MIPLKLGSVFLLTLLIGCGECFSQAFTSSNLPIVVLNTGNTYISDEPKVIAEMGIIDNGPGIRNNLSDPFNNYEGMIAIERRGSSSQMFPKAQYGLELRSSVGADTSVSLLGMPEEEDWILFAPYNDRTLMRDVLAYKMARDLKRYAPRTRYCELVLNGAYEGVYVLEEKIKRDKNRVDISALNPEELSGDDVTGGYIVKVDKVNGEFAGGFYSDIAVTSGRTYFQVDYPNPLPVQQQEYIQQFIRSFEEALRGDDFAHPQQGYEAYIDVPSFIDFMIVNEVSKNVDAYRISTFMHKDKNSNGGKLTMGPVWDFNLGFGNADYCTSGNAQGFVYETFNSICPQDGLQVPFWWMRLMQDYSFQKQLGDRWVALRQGPFATDKVHAYIDSVADVLNTEAQQRNFERWPVMGMWLWPNYYVGSSFQDEISYLKRWLSDRLNWLDNHWNSFVLEKEVTPETTALRVYPNPSANEWNVECSNVGVGELTMELINAHGRSVFLINRKNFGGELKERLPNHLLSKGLYVLQLSINGRPIAGKKLLKE